MLSGRFALDAPPPLSTLASIRVTCKHLSLLYFSVGPQDESCCQTTRWLTRGFLGNAVVHDGELGVRGP